MVEAVRACRLRPILVGHSIGGLFSQAAEMLADGIDALVYVAGLLPADGSSMMTFVERFDPAYLAEFVWAENGRTAQLTPEGVRRFLYSHCPAAVVEPLLGLLTPEPVEPFQTPVQLTDANFGRVPKYYVETLQDRVVRIELQRSMRSHFAFRGVYTLDTGHAPFFSMPGELVQVLEAIAAGRQ